MAETKETGVVTKTGSSATVVLPAAWRRRNNVQIGDVLDVNTSVDGQITFSKRHSPSKEEDVAGHFALVESLPSIPWRRGDSPDDDKELIGGRYV